MSRSRLNGNQLSGSIPSSLGSLTGLQQLCVRLDAYRSSLRLPLRRVRVLLVSHTPVVRLRYLDSSGLCGAVPTPHQPSDGSLPACASPPPPPISS